MKEFFLILFFGKSILLTPDAVTLFGESSFILQKPIKAVTSGASINIDISSLVKWDEREGIAEFRRRAEKKFPGMMVEAWLFKENYEIVKFIYKGNILFNKEIAKLDLTSNNEVPTDVEFKKIKIFSQIKLEHVNIYWKNYKF